MPNEGITAVYAAEARRAASPPPAVKYIDNATFRRQRAALTRAKNSHDPRKVVDTVVKTVREWNAGGYAWPDSWATWNVALDDALIELRLPRIHVDDIR